MKDWQISTCVNCKCDVYAVSTANDSSVYINPMLLTTPGPCPNCFLPSSRSPSPISNGSSSNGNEKKFSPAFHVMVDVKAPSITEEGKAPTYGNEEEMTLFDMLQTSFNKFVDDEQHQMAQRIAAYTEQESKELERVRTRALRDRDALWSKIKSYLNERNKKLARPTPTHPQTANMITTSSVSMQGTRNTRSKKGKKGQSDAHSKKTSSIAQSNTLSAQAQTLQTQMIVVNSPPQNQQQQHLHSMQDTIRVDPSPSPPSSQKSSPLVLAHKVAPLRPQPLQQQQTQPQQQQGTWSRSSKPSQLIQQQQQQQQKQQDTLGVSDNYGSGSDVFKLEEEYDEDIGQGTTNDGDSIEEEGNETSGSFSDNSSSNQEGDIDIDEEKAGMCSGAAPAMVSDMAVDNDNTYTATTGAGAATTGLVQGNNFEIQFRRDRAYNPSNTAYQFTLSTSLPIPITGNGRAGNGNGSGSGSGNNNNNNNNNSNSNSVRYKRQLQSQQQHQQQQYPYPQHGSASITTNSSQQRGGRKNGGGGAGVVVGVGGGHGKCCSTSFSGDGLQILYDNSNRDDNDVSSSFKVPQSLNKNTRAFLYV